MRLFLFLVFVCLLSCQPTEKIDPPERPNVLLILTDDQGYSDLSIKGNQDINTPHIDQLFKQGASFDRFYVSAVCSPTRAEILTGRYAVRGGVYSTSAGGERLDLDEETIAEIFSRAGYNTGAFGKWHNGTQYPYHPNARGFDEYYGFASGHWGHYFSPMLEHNQKIVTGDGYLTDDLTNKAIDFISTSTEEGRPFFAYVPFNIPHSPMQVPDENWDTYADRELLMDHPDKRPESILHTKAALAMCENVDMNVGRLVSHLQELDIEENTIVIYLSDNGPNGNRWNSCMKGRKGSTDEGGVRSPLVMQWKNQIPAGLEITQIGSALDILPTLTDMCSIVYQAQNKLDGVSLKSAVMDQDLKPRERYIINYWRDKTSIRSQQYRLSHDDLLFDISNDPCQLSDLAETQKTVFDKLYQTRQIWKEQVLSELPETDARTFPIGHPLSQYDHLPARDARVTGSIKRSNRYPNDSFWTDWTSSSDSILWPVEVLEPGTFDVTVYYTCAAKTIGSILKVSCMNVSAEREVLVAHDPPLVGMDEDRSPRTESYVKEFMPLSLGRLELKKGKAVLALTAQRRVGGQLPDIRLLIMERV